MIIDWQDLFAITDDLQQRFQVGWPAREKSAAGPSAEMAQNLGMLNAASERAKCFKCKRSKNRTKIILTLHKLLFLSRENTHK